MISIQAAAGRKPSSQDLQVTAAHKGRVDWLRCVYIGPRLETISANVRLVDIAIPKKCIHA